MNFLEEKNSISTWLRLIDGKDRLGCGISGGRVPFSSQQMQGVASSRSYNGSLSDWRPEGFGAPGDQTWTSVRFPVCKSDATSRMVLILRENEALFEQAIKYVCYRHPHLLICHHYSLCHFDSQEAWIFSTSHSHLLAILPSTGGKESRERQTGKASNPSGAAGSMISVVRQNSCKASKC